ncbi:hypothetical protein PT286_02010 [Neisseriaceae bacterium ESL0693]|nr:hypothetical protein [Neisseriaceae bacterium ESL0693]
MFNKPEEFIMAILAGLWVVLTFIICRYINMPTDTGLLTTALTLLWALVFFLLWQRGLSRSIWPVFLGILVICWWRAIYWSGTQIVLNGNNQAQTEISWYAQWPALIIYALIPVAIGYFIKWQRSRHRQPDKL